MKFDQYYSARSIIEDIVTKDWLGPVTDDEIICGERPLDYYILGKLYPKDCSADEVLAMSAEDCGELDSEDGISLCDGKNPSSFGVSFALGNEAVSFKVTGKAARYKRIDFEEANKLLDLPEDAQDKKKDYWKREQIPTLFETVDASELKLGKTIRIQISEGLAIRVINHRIMKDGSRIVTVTMTNENVKSDDYKKDAELAFFQPELIIEECKGGNFRELSYKVSLDADEEIKELGMLYKDVRNYASGHGCAVNVSCDKGIRIIKNDFLPSFEVLQMKPSDDFKGSILSMKYLSEAPAKSVISGMNELMDMYSDWIENQDNISQTPEFRFKEEAKRNLEKCRQTLARVRKSVNCLENKEVYRAFSLANRAMFEQRKNMLVQNGRFSSDDSICWYPFQLAFFMQEICSFADPESVERKQVDLLWFPTGGGKTEAYLGIAAFVIFLRRIRQPSENDGVTVLMRYTMRLLTFQQFERAAAMICACENIRREEKIPGGEIGIGLWAGEALTPNYIEDAQKILNGEELEYNREVGSPIQITKCPFCGTTIGAENYSCDGDNKRMLIRCPSERCKFHDGLPIYLVDEDIYEHRPTYIVATIDKYAQIALKEECSNLFGVGKSNPPELIIQDELHLISGPLGTITGLYEAAIKKLCSNGGVDAKIIASTATIRNAKEQIRALYASDYTQFPPQGLDIKDSFFAKISTRDEKPGRLYLGCMGIGTSPTTMMIRVMAALLYATRYLSEQEDIPEDVVDAYWTLTSYFNTLRELGGAIIRVVDDIQDRFLYLQSSKFSKVYAMKTRNQRYTKYKELTSREKSQDIGKVIQEELPIKYSKDGSTYPYDFVLSSNMISVGVDVGRLGTMVVVGQPKTTAEYIQATSRVGRENPGLVIATYNQAKSRDRSHYEQFSQYHASFYKYVEATSITPFADRARDRALQTLYVILCRYMIPSLFGDKDAINFRRDMPELKAVRDYIFEYVKRVDPDELTSVKHEIEEIEEEWDGRRKHKEKFRYRKTKYVSSDNALFDADYEEDSRFRVLNTMRSVENSVLVKIKE